MENSKSNKTLLKTVFTGLFTAISFVLYLWEFPIIPGNAALKFDLSDIPALIGAMCFGPAFGVMVELLKNVIELMVKGVGSQMGFGNLMNFLVGCAFIVPFSLIFSSLKENKIFGKYKAIIIAGICATCCIVAVGALANYFIAPLYFRYFVNYEITKEALWGFIGMAAILNVIKGIMLSVCAYPISEVLMKRLKFLKLK